MSRHQEGRRWPWQQAVLVGRWGQGQNGVSWERGRGEAVREPACITLEEWVGKRRARASGQWQEGGDSDGGLSPPYCLMTGGATEPPEERVIE